MRTGHLLFLCLTLSLPVHGQEPGTVEVRLFGAEGQDEATAVWADEHGILMAGETTSDIVMAEGQAVWAPGGPAGRKGFIAAFDTALGWSWSFSFAGDTHAPLDAPSAVAVRDVVRSPLDSATAWVLYDAPVDGQWQSTLMGVHPDDGVVARHEWSTAGTITSAALVKAGGSGFIWVGAEAASSVPGGAQGIRLGFWDGAVASEPTFAWLEGAEGHAPVAADWWADTLFIAAEGPDPEAPFTVLRVTVVNGNPQLVGTAPIADPDLTLADVTAGPEGVAWSGTLLSQDGTLDAVYGRLTYGPDPFSPGIWGQEWIQVTVAEEDRPGRSLLWAGDVLQCTSRTTEAGAGGHGILVQTRYGPTGAWFGAHVFGGEADEQIGDMAVDHEGRLLLAGSSNSWTDLGPGNGSQDAALFRISTMQLVNGFETTVEQAVLPEAAFVGLPSPGASEANPTAMVVHGGTVMPFEDGIRWSLLDAAGRRIAQGLGGEWTCRGPEGWRFLTESDGAGHIRVRRIWVAP